jgi:hypothetical protein
MTRYRLPDALGGAEVKILNHLGGGNTPDVVVQVEGIGRVTLPALCLVKVEPPMPAEPPPGAHLIGDVLCVRYHRAFKQTDAWVAFEDEAPWHGRRGQLAAMTGGTFEEMWERHGGPDVAITPLVPETDLRGAPKLTAPFTYREPENLVTLHVNSQGRDGVAFVAQPHPEGDELYRQYGVVLPHGLAVTLAFRILATAPPDVVALVHRSLVAARPDTEREA